jgi:enoyl-CoA hydratase/carnithine racemase
MPGYREIRYESADHVATLTRHRPEQRNEFIRPHISALRQTEDHREGVRALQERRLPRFQGR